MKFIGFILIMDGYSEDRRVRQSRTVRLINFCEPLVFGKVRTHVIDILDSDRRRPRTYT